MLISPLGQASWCSACARSEQCAELVRRHADDLQDAPQGARRHVLAWVNRDRDGTAIEVLHHMMTASNPRDGESSALQRFDYLCSRYDRDAARHNPASYQKSGNVECQSQLIRWFDYFEQGFESGAQVCDRLFLCRAIAYRTNTGSELGGGAPDAVLILLYDVGHVNDTSHVTEYGMPEGRTQALRTEYGTSACWKWQPSATFYLFYSQLSATVTFRDVLSCSR
jgi:hypothetical protein